MVSFDMLAVCLAMIENENDKKRFEDLYRKYKGLMFHKALGILKDTYYAEDAVSIAALNIAMHMDMVEDIESIRTSHLLMTITQRVAFNLYKKLK